MQTIAKNVNCGYARVAIKELEEDFKTFFQASLHINEEYFLQKHGKKSPLKYKKNLQKLLLFFKKNGILKAKKTCMNKLLVLKTGKA